MADVAVECGRCGGPVHFETCEQNGGPPGHHWVLTSECQRCGDRYDNPTGCLDCKEAASA